MKECPEVESILDAQPGTTGVSCPTLFRRILALSGKYCEKWARLFVRLDPGLARRRHCLGHFLLLKHKTEGLTSCTPVPNGYSQYLLTCRHGLLRDIHDTGLGLGRVFFGHLQHY